MGLSLHLTFDGSCRAALTHYARTLGGTISYLATYGESPMADQVPETARDWIMHATLVVDGAFTLMGNDVLPEAYARPQGFAVVVGTADPATARRCFDALSDGGTVLMPLEATFWAVAFGVVTDRFGVTWEINCEQAQPAASAGE